MEINWIKFKESKFASKCRACGKQIEEGCLSYGTKDPSLAVKGKWFVVCPDCMKNDDIWEEIKREESGLREEVARYWVSPALSGPVEMESISDVEALMAALGEDAPGGDPPKLPEYTFALVPGLPAFTPARPGSVSFGESKPIDWEGKVTSPLPVHPLPPTHNPWSIKGMTENATWRI